MKVSVANSAGGSFCWNYGTDTFYGNYAGGNFLLHTLVDYSVAVMLVTVSVAVMQLEVSAVLMQVTVSVANMWVTVFLVILQMGVSVAVMKVVLSAVDCAHDSSYCNYAVDSFFIAM